MGGRNHTTVVRLRLDHITRPPRPQFKIKTLYTSQQKQRYKGVDAQYVLHREKKSIKIV